MVIVGFDGFENGEERRERKDFYPPIMMFSNENSTWGDCGTKDDFTSPATYKQIFVVKLICFGLADLEWNRME